RHHPTRHSFPTRRSSDLEVDNFTGIPPPFIVPTILSFSALPLKLESCVWTRFPLRSRSKPNPLGKVVLIFPPLVLSFNSFSSELDRKSTRLNSSHVKISY